MLSPPAEISISTPLRGILRIPGRDQAPERGHKNQLKLRVLARLAPLAVPPHGRQKAEPAKHFVKQAIIKEAIWCTKEDIMPSMLHAPKTLHSNCGVFNPHNVQLEGPSAREQRSCLPVIGIAPPCLCGGLCFPANTISPGNQTLHARGHGSWRGETHRQASKDADSRDTSAVALVCSCQKLPMSHQAKD